ncbi:Guanylate cyclase [Nesidiocoris tenuis]|uniref:Guanylate cyclase n=1 Tax=Nesidiocoris tenuis TaxID=355587 RepID=A0ABN7BAY5_9HEMI|nr:Guanylate cyclase [Nesidiocoris tenuis]
MRVSLGWLRLWPLLSFVAGSSSTLPWTSAKPDFLDLRSGQELYRPVEPDDVINATIMLPTDNSYVISAEKVSTVLRMAGRRLSQLLPGKIIQFRYFDEGCRGDKSLKTAFEAFEPKRQKWTHVVFGPTCEFSAATVGRLMKFFDVPLLTTGAMTWDFLNNKTRPSDEFYGLVRVGPIDFLHVAMFINAINDWFDWSRVMLLYERDGQKDVSGESTCKLMMESLVQSFVNRSDKVDFRASDIGRANDIRKLLMEEVGVDYSDLDWLYSDRLNLWST